MSAPIKWIEAGSVFGRWLVVGPSADRSNGAVLWNCICECGTSRPVSGLRLRRGDSRSCGCLRAELLTKHGGAREGNRHPLYATWTSNVGTDRTRYIDSDASLLKRRKHALHFRVGLDLHVGRTAPPARREPSMTRCLSNPGGWLRLAVDLPRPRRLTISLPDEKPGEVL